MGAATLILLRHGESEWNALNLFTGWVDVDLTDKGRAEATRGGELPAGGAHRDGAGHRAVPQRAGQLVGALASQGHR